MLQSASRQTSDELQHLPSDGLDGVVCRAGSDLSILTASSVTLSPSLAFHQLGE
jgi:hypothetical protein